MDQTLKKTTFYLIALMIALNGYLYMENNIPLSAFQNQQPISAQIMPKSKQKAEIRALRTSNQLETTVKTTKIESIVRLGSTSRKNDSLEIIFDISKISQKTKVTKAILNLTVAAESKKPLQATISSELAENSVNLNQLFGFNKFTQIQSPDLSSLINEVINNSNSEHQIKLIIKSKSQSIPIYSASSDYPPTLLVEY